MRIMYVEDNAINLGLVRRIAKMGNHDVISHANGPDALKALEIEQVDLILMDIELEGEMDGIEVVKRLRARGDKRPIVAVTAYAMVGDKERILEAGCNGYLPKPLPVAQFLQILAKYDPANAPKLATQEISAVKTEPQAPTTPTKKVDEVSQPSASDAPPSPIETKSTPSSISAPSSENAQKSTPIEKDMDITTTSTSSTASASATSQPKDIEKTSASPTSEPTTADTSAVAAQPESTEETTPSETTATPEKPSSDTVQSIPPPSTNQE